jgi:hypothetical protein
MRLIAVLLLLLSTSAVAQAQRIRPATEADFIGYWRIQLVPNELHRSELQNEKTGYADPCQFFVHKPDGSWFNISHTNGAGVEETKRRCPATKRADIDLSLYVSLHSFGKASPYKWSKMPNQDGLFYVRDMSGAESRVVLWKADYILVDIPESASRGYDFKKGDLLMQLTRRVNATSVTPIWPMVLRPVLD